MQWWSAIHNWMCSNWAQLKYTEGLRYDPWPLAQTQSGPTPAHPQIIVCNPGNLFDAVVIWLHSVYITPTSPSPSATAITSPGLHYLQTPPCCSGTSSHPTPFVAISYLTPTSIYSSFLHWLFYFGHWNNNEPISIFSFHSFKCYRKFILSSITSSRRCVSQILVFWTPWILSLLSPYWPTSTCLHEPDTFSHLSPDSTCKGYIILATKKRLQDVGRNWSRRRKTVVLKWECGDSIRSRDWTVVDGVTKQLL